MKIDKALFGLMICSIALSGCSPGTEVQVSGSPEISPMENTPEKVLSPAPTEIHIQTDTFDPTEVDLSNLVGLPADRFFDEAYSVILLRDPETVIELGLDHLNVAPGTLTNVSPEFLEETRLILLDLLALVETYDYDSLEETGRISMMVFEWYLADRIKEIEYINFAYPVTNFSLRSIPQLAIMFFTDTFPLNSSTDASEYVGALDRLDEKVYQVIERLQVNAEAGILPPEFIIQKARGDIKNQLGHTAQSSPLYRHLQDQLQGIEGLDRAQIDQHASVALGIITEKIFPAFDFLDAYLLELQGEGTSELGLDQFVGGEEYYQYLLEHFTTTTLTAEEIHQLGLLELERVIIEIRQTFVELGYPEDLDIPTLYGRMISDGHTLTGNAIAEEYRRILSEAEASLNAYFDLRPSQPLEVVGGEVGAFYSPGALDGSRPGQFYARVVGTESTYKMKTVAYHEGIPGHHYQISIAQESELPLFRKILIFDGYAEGWALYGEYLARELGWYADDPHGNLGRLQYEALRAARMIVDTGIHTKKWSYDQAVDFLVANTGISEGFARWEVERYIAYPGQAPAYTVGKLKIQELRQIAMDTLGERFDIKDFHNIILKNGSLPLTILEVVVENWIEETLKSLG